MALEARRVPVTPVVPEAPVGPPDLLLPGARLIPAVLAVPGDLLDPLLRWLPVHLEARAVLAVLEPDPARYSTVG